jgi:hypothetical protein
MEDEDRGEVKLNTTKYLKKEIYKLIKVLKKRKQLFSNLG